MGEWKSGGNMVHFLLPPSTARVGSIVMQLVGPEQIRSALDRAHMLFDRSSFHTFENVLYLHVPILIVRIDLVSNQLVPFCNATNDLKEQQSSRSPSRPFRIRPFQNRPPRT